MTSVQDESMQVTVDSAAIRVVRAGQQGPAGPASVSPGAVITTEGDLIIGGTSGTPIALAAGDIGQQLGMAPAGRPIWVNTPFNAKALDAIGDGTSHPLSERYATLVEAQADHPHATALTDQIDWAVIQGAVNTLRDREIAGSTGDPWNGGKLELPHGVYQVNKQFVNPANVIAEGEGRGATALAATDAFPINTPLVVLGEYGSALLPLAFGCRLENLSLDCNGISGSTGVASSTIQEHSGLDHVSIYNWTANAGIFDGSSSGGSIEHFILSDIEAYSANKDSTGTTIDPNPTGFKFTEVGIATLENVTCNHTGLTNSSGYAFELNAAHLECDVLQAEKWQGGALAYNQSSLVVRGMGGKNITAGMVECDSSTLRLDLTDIGLVNSGPVGYYLFDQVKGGYTEEPVIAYSSGTQWLGQMGLSTKGYTTSVLPPSTTQLPDSLSWSIHTDTNLNKVYLAFNWGGTIFKVELV